MQMMSREKLKVTKVFVEAEGEGCSETRYLYSDGRADVMTVLEQAFTPVGDGVSVQAPKRRSKGKRKQPKTKAPVKVQVKAGA